MRHAARLQSALEILERITKSHIPMDNTIRDYMAHKRYIGSKDRAAIVERVYRITRSYARLVWHLEKAKQEITPRAFILADLMLNEECSSADIDTIFNGEKFCAAPLNDSERLCVQHLNGSVLNDPDMPEEVRAECPDWAYAKLKNLWGDNFLSQMVAMQEPALLDLRVNTLKAMREKVQDMLSAQEVETELTPYSPVGLRVKGKAFMSATKAFSKGLVEIQDEGSQLIALLCDAKPGMRVLDYCAGAGGKTLGLAAQMENKGNIVAMDIDARRLEKGRRRYKKAGVHNVELRCLDDEKTRKWLRRQKGTMDIVLVDAPCSSSGTWRRNPDLRWKQYGPSLEEIKTMQADILERAADKVKPGGKLVYATCSLFQEENEGQVERFLSGHPEFSVLPWDQTDHSFVSKPDIDGPYMRLFPGNHGTDGFFCALLIRN